MKPHISVIMPAFNAAPWIGQAIESMRLQKETSWELLVVDDGSTDETKSIVEQYVWLDPRIHLLSNERCKGAGGARNTGMQQARGKFVAFLDSDDVFFPNALAALQSLLHTSGLPMVRARGATLCMMRWLGWSLTTDKPRICHGKSGFPDSTFWLHMFRADFLAHHGILFDERLSRGEDYHFLCHAYALADTPPMADEIIHIYRVNHKAEIMTPAHADSFLTLACDIRSMFERFYKDAWIAPCIEEIFLSRWMHCLHAQCAMGDARAEAYLSECLSLFSSRKCELIPALRRCLRDASEPFFSLWSKKSVSEILALFKCRGLISPLLPFNGITMKLHGINRHLYTLPRKIKNSITNKHTQSYFLYLARLYMAYFSHKRMHKMI